MDVPDREIKELGDVFQEERFQGVHVSPSGQSGTQVNTTMMQYAPLSPNELRGSLMGMPKPENKEGGINKHARTLSLDSQNFLSHVLSVDGDELYNLLLSEPGATSHSPGKAMQLARNDSDETMLADLMHTLMDDPQFQAQPDQKQGHLKVEEIPLFSDKTLNAVLGEEFREIAAEVSREQETERHEEVSAPSLVALPTHQPQHHQHHHQQFLTLLDGTVLQRDDGAPVIATLPEGQVQLTVPLPGSSSVLQYIPLLDSTVISEQQPTLKPQTDSRQHESPFEERASMLLSPSQTEEIIAAAAKQHSELQEASRGVVPKPQLRPIDSTDAETTETSIGQGLLHRKVSHKRERSLNAAKLMSSESLQAPDSKIINNSGSLDGQFSSDFLEKPSPNSPLHNSDSIIGKDASADFGLYIKPIKLFSDGLEIDDEIAKIIEETLATPPGMKKRGRPPGRSKNADNIPGFVEPTDAEILANLLLENNQLKAVPPDELKKLIRKEKNKISAAISRYRIQHETKVLESKLKKLEQEKLSLSQWLHTAPEIQPHRILLAEGQNIPCTGEEVPRPPVRHLSL